MEALRAWRAMPARIERAIDGLTERELDLRGGSEQWSIRETVHHLVEANLIASNIVIAALAKNGCTYDWSWVTPSRAWMGRLGYDEAPVRPALEMLRALVRHVSNLVGATAGAKGRKVKLLDEPGAKLRTVTVEDVLREEAKHAQDHLRDLAEIRRLHAR